MQRVAGGDQQHNRVLFCAQVLEVSGLAVAPRRLGLPGHRDGVGAAHDDARHPVARLAPDAGLDLCAVGEVFDRVVQRAPMAASSLPPCSSTSAATDIRWAR